MDRFYWTVKFISVFTDFFLSIATIAFIYLLIVHMRDLKDEIRNLIQTIIERRKNG